MGDALLDLAGPARCAGCRVGAGPLCSDCRRLLRAPEAGAPILGVDAVAAPWAYEKGARALVLALKLGGQRDAGTPLSAAMATAAAMSGAGGEVIAWVPGRRPDIRVRGFDHAEVLAAGVARRLGLPVARLLERSTRRPPDQASLGAAQRRRNLEGAFVGKPCAGRILLVDDLVTTGATARCCASALRAAGASGVDVAVACRA